MSCTYWTNHKSHWKYYLNLWEGHSGRGSAYWRDATDTLTTKNQEKVSSGENIEEAHATQGHVQEVNVEANQEPEKQEEENEHGRKVEVYEDNQNKTKDQTNDLITPDSKTEAGCLIRYSVSATPRLQR